MQSKWKDLTGVICDKKIPTKIKLRTDIPDSGSTDVALRLRNLANVGER